MNPTLRAYRDDGALAQAARRADLPVSSLAITTIGVVLLVAGNVLPVASVGTASLAGVFAFVLCGVAGAAGRAHPRLEWLVPALVRGGEYGAVLWLASSAGAMALAPAYGLLAGVAFHHYDIVYRLRHLQVGPPRWVAVAGGGWEGRLLVLGLAASVDLLIPIAIIVAVWCTLLYVVESVATWIAVARDEQRIVDTGELEEEDVP